MSAKPTTQAANRPQADYWGQGTAHYDAEVVGAGEKRQCQSCGARFDVAMIAATEDTSSQNWEEFYECQQCGAAGSFRFYGDQDRREWIGQVAYPEDRR
jgi:uncharacterized Fe-S center protein